MNKTKLEKIHWKCDGFGRITLNGEIRTVVLKFSKTTLGFEVVCEPDTIHFRKRDKPVLNNNTFHFEDNGRKWVDSNSEAMTFISMYIKENWKMSYQIKLFLTVKCVGGCPFYSTRIIEGDIKKPVKKFYFVIILNAFKISMTFIHEKTDSEGSDIVFQNR